MVLQTSQPPTNGLTSAFHGNGKRSSTKEEEMICIVFITDILMKQLHVQFNQK